ncbi:MAG TPA: methionine--tRNA ligase [Candidatus Ornithomonoglobus intestinigallinarum]|uniref:Methionine--tRNA ligase n=1 Tax=Candidatus Ornithomonoglobus intestinigallinarum TaxID=2840894 RepID=A0A9D1KPI3_9FIRM|nr:methionine--tRNA ligase [Candidatus Ornithomonoglobus intestinigallinarum]
MEKQKEKFYITTAIAYTSRTPHIGNTYEIILTDAIARFNRFIGKDVFFLTGTDEHGIKIQEIAEAAGITPKEHVDKIAGEIRDIADMLNISYDKFIRTTDDYHVKAVQKIFKRLYDQGDIYKGEYEGLYCTPCESFWTETQLVDGKCPDCGREVKPMKEEAYFFKMSKYQDRLMKYIEEHPEFIQPESRKKEMVNNFLKPGLQDLCVSRTSFTWGVPVDFDPGHVVYVWIDALSNYITALGYTPDEKGELYKKYWPADVHIIGKDILRFHTIYWPIMLMALGEPLPKQVFGHPWMLVGEEKMSKSRGNVIYAQDLVKHFGVDAVRYYSLHEMPFAQDGTITYDVFMSRYNSDLANTLGNLVNRTVAMINKYFGGVIPEGDTAGEFDDDLKAVAAGAVEKVSEKMKQLRVADSLDEIWKVVDRANKYIDETAPWVLAKDEARRARLGTVLYNLAETIRIIAALLSSFMPETAGKIAAQINTDALSYESIKSFGALESGVKVGEAVPIFARIDIAKKTEELEAEAEAAAAPEVETAPYKDVIDFEDFEKLDIRVGKVLECEKVPKSSKLLRFVLEVGSEKRQILSGIAKYHKPEELTGKNVLFVANLKPRKIMGLESQGMILSAEYKDGLTVLTTLNDIQSGAEIV